MKQATPKWKYIAGCTGGVILLSLSVIGFTRMTGLHNNVQTIQVFFEEDIPKETCVAIIKENSGNIISEENSIGMYTVQMKAKSTNGAKKLCNKLKTYPEVEDAILLDTSVEPGVQGFREVDADEEM